jgi:hypothetical protein
MQNTLNSTILYSNKIKTNVFRVYSIFSIFILLSFFCGLLFAGSNSEPHGKKEAKTSSFDSHSDIFKRIDNLIISAQIEINQNNDEIAFDSLFSIAIALTESTFQNEAEIEVYQSYFNLVNSDGPKVHYQNIVTRTEQLTIDNENSVDKSNLWLCISSSASRLNYHGIAHKFALKAFSEADLEKNPAKKVRAYLALGKSLQIQKYYIEAFQNYLNAVYLTEALENETTKDEVKKNCFSHLFEFYRNVNDFDQAAKYKLLEIELIQSHLKKDSLELFWAKYDMCGLAILSKKYGSVVNALDELLRFGSKTKNKKLRDFTFSIYRQYLVQNNDLAGFQKIYVEKYPEELERMKTIQPVLYHQIKSKLAEYNNNIEEARLEYEKAISQIQKNESPVFISNFFNRYGNFLIKNGKMGEAINSFQKAFLEAEKSQYTDFMIESSYYLDSLYSLIGNFAAAHKYSNINKKLMLQQTFVNKQDEFLRMELANESRQIAFDQKRLEDEQKRRFNLQYFIITLSIIFFFLIFIIFSRLKVPEWSIKGLGFISVLMLFEFIILILDHEIHHFTHGAPLWIFAIKVLILIFLFPLHHIIERAIIKFMIQKKQIWRPRKSHFREVIHKLWPWMKVENEEKQ